MFDLAAVLPQLLPRAVAWAEAHSARICASGVTLSPLGVRLAHAVGVVRSDLIRVNVVRQLPLPEDPQLRFAALQTGLLGPNMVGMTLGYGIYIVDGNQTNRLISHECRHVAQYESAGSIASFLPVYLQQIAIFGYQQAPLEVDARAHERDVA